MKWGSGPQTLVLYRMRPTVSVQVGSVLRGASNHRGQPLDLDMIARKIIKPTLEKAGLKWMGWHGFRRGPATNLYRLGVSDKTIQGILRQANVSTIMNLYVKAVWIGCSGRDAGPRSGFMQRLCNESGF